MMTTTICGALTLLLAAKNPYAAELAFPALVFREARSLRVARYTGDVEKRPAEILRDALALPLEARALLVDSLIESLDQTVDEGAEKAWAEEIQVRLQQIDTGAVDLIPWEAARRRLRSHDER
jgi:putative addiction module component (TIGR02574 family)